MCYIDQIRGEVLMFFSSKRKFIKYLFETAILAVIINI